jgi:hypothetical protein
VSLPYENATSGDKAVGEMQKILRQFGCSKFGTMVDDEAGELLVQFEHKGRPVMVKGSMKGYAAAWLKHHPYSSRMHCTKIQHERKALEIANIAVYSMVRDWIKGQVTAVEVGLLSFEGAFLGQMMLPTGRTILDELQTRSEFAAIAGPKG